MMVNLESKKPANILGIAKRRAKRNKIPPLG